MKVTRAGRGVMLAITGGATELGGDVIGHFTAALRMDTCLKLARLARVEIASGAGAELMHICDVIGVVAAASMLDPGRLARVIGPGVRGGR